MSTAPVSLRQRRREQTRDELVGTLLAIIADDGVDAVTIDRVVQKSGMARGTLYAHFPGGRDELLRAAYAQLGCDLVVRSRAAVTSATSPSERLVALARVMLEVAEDHRVGFFYNVSGPVILASAPERGGGSGASLDMVTEALADARAAGGLDSAVDPHAIAVLLVGALREAGVAVAAGRLDAGRALAGFQLLVKGLLAPPERQLAGGTA